MSESTSFELGSVDRPTRFQVNPVNHKKNDKDIGKDDVPHEVYRRLTNIDGEPVEDDQFNEDASQMPQQPRTQR